VEIGRQAATRFRQYLTYPQFSHGDSNKSTARKRLPCNRDRAHTGLASDKKYQIWQQVVCLNSVTSKTCRAVRRTQFLCVRLAATPVLAIGMEVYAEN